MSIIEFIRDRARYYNCPVCGRSLKGCEVRMLNHVDDRFTVRVTCAACHVDFIVILAIQGPGLEAVPEDELQVELEQGGDALAMEEPGALARGQIGEVRAEPIASDEILDVHLILKDFDGPLTALLEQPNPRRA